MDIFCVIFRDIFRRRLLFHVPKCSHNLTKIDAFIKFNITEWLYKYDTSIIYLLPYNNGVQYLSFRDNNFESKCNICDYERVDYVQ